MPVKKLDKIPFKSSSYKWFRMYQSPLVDIAKDREITGCTYRVLFGLLSIVDFHNEADISQKALGRMIGVHPPDVSKALSVLQKKGIIKKVLKPNGRTAYILQNTFVTKGKTAHLELVR
jgi:DNA-binding MarR family transcriptional regulator